MCRIILGGTGGQGILTLGRLIASAAMHEGMMVACYPVYGAEIRGGYTFSSLTISNGPIASPIISRAEAGVFMDPFACRHLRPMVARGAVVILNADLPTVFEGRGCRVFPLAAITLAREVGDERCANMVAAGFLARAAADFSRRLRPFPSLDALAGALADVFPAKPGLVALNRKALEKGFARPGAGCAGSAARPCR